MSNRSPMAYVVWGLVILLVILHQDVWFWDDTTLVWGFMPITLLWHAGISVSAAFVWYLATVFCWPRGLEEETMQVVAEKKAPAGGPHA